MNFRLENNWCIYNEDGEKVCYPVLYVEKDEFVDIDDFEMFFTVLKALFIKDSIYGFSESEAGLQKKDYLEIFFENNNCTSFAFICCNTKKIAGEDTRDNFYATVDCYAATAQNDADYKKVAVIAYEVEPQIALRDSFDYTQKLYYKDPTESKKNENSAQKEENGAEKKKRGRPKKKEGEQ